MWAAKLVLSNEETGLMPDVPASRRVQKTSFPVPIGETTPMPVMTTRFIYAVAAALCDSQCCTSATDSFTFVALLNSSSGMSMPNLRSTAIMISMAIRESTPSWSMKWASSGISLVSRSVTRATRFLTSARISSAVYVVAGIVLGPSVFHERAHQFQRRSRVVLLLILFVGCVVRIVLVRAIRIRAHRMEGQRRHRGGERGVGVGIFRPA